ncbi:branched-chain amino acid ABC transporter permease [Burkholderia sp. THE68]|uniref:urea ABC transporter permease subunit UrtC n=1 Tax=Burkholderia sp. THE68 TaxID=758782 RepID=UPI0013183C83|nr:urea ABC transporter permease subunit UrtC [Burkholderia sp. THE68]BBU30299.1 branched-chain amino acid ABC transporter permease [Burkholderia sp. THE68]
MKNLSPRSLSWFACGLTAVVVVALPFLVEPFWIGEFGKYLAFSLVAIGIVISWGYCGILSLGQGIFFGIGGYALAMFLKLEASAPNLPDFMVWSSVNELPWWWQPFAHFPVAVAAILVVPVAIAFPLSYALFAKRVSGVYFAIVTLALSLTMTVLIIGQQGDTGGANGITDFKTLMGADILSDEARQKIYFVETAIIVLAMMFGVWLIQTRLGKILIAIRDREDRVRFSGYDTALFKAFVFSAAAVLSSIGGALFTLQVGLVSPASIGAVASVEMVIYAAVGGRLSVPGAVLGALLVGFMKSYLSERFPEGWLFFLGAMFILVVAVMPRGLAGVTERLFRRGDAA